MKADNSMSEAFLSDYPADAARVLEHVNETSVAAFFSELSPQLVAPVVSVMLPEKSSTCLAIMNPMLAAKIMAEVPVLSAARIYRLLASEQQKAVMLNLSGKFQKALNRNLAYPSSTAGALIDPAVDLLPENITVADAIRRVERAEHPVVCDIYVINDSLQLTGVIELGKLLISKHHLTLREVMSRKTQAISAHTDYEKLLSHPGWRQRRRLPVIERNKTFVGVLDMMRLQDALGESGKISTVDPMDNLLSLVSLYWLSLAELLSSLFSQGKTDKGDQ